MRLRSKILFTLTLYMMVACQHQERREAFDFYSSPLFRDVQHSAIFPDSKTFVDCVPRTSYDNVLDDYNRQHSQPNFNLRQFVQQHFILPQRPVSHYTTDANMSMEEHLTSLWPVLTREGDRPRINTSLIELPESYIVPGGRFSEIYYWDSYFTMLGLKVQQRYDLMASMTKNFAFLIDTLGFIPNGNRDYYLTRSQPPFFSLMLRLQESQDSLVMDHYLPQLEREYQFWMKGAETLQNPGDVAGHTVKMPDGTILNRYFDQGQTPRPEAFKEDEKLARTTQRPAEALYRDLRSAAESGWDFSSRWLADPDDLATIRTTEIIPIDLNCLLWHLERALAEVYQRKQDVVREKSYRQKASERKRAILTFCWDAASGYFYDYDFKASAIHPVKTLAGAYPLFMSLVSPDIAQQVAKTLEKDFLKPGGLVTTVHQTGQQWDAPNGWAPLQWIVYRGLKQYAQHDLAATVRQRWLHQNERVYKATGKMMEKYNVMDTTLTAGGGEYPNQDGFGWTNGVALALLHEH